MLERLPKPTSRAGVESLLQEAAFHRIAGPRERGSKMLPRTCLSVTSMLQLAECRVVEGIAFHPFDAGDGVNLFEAALRTLALGDRDGSVERDDR